jgi:hypothetical protein
MLVMWMMCRRSLESPGVSPVLGASIYANATFHSDGTAVNRDICLHRSVFQAGIL